MTLQRRLDVNGRITRINTIVSRRQRNTIYYCRFFTLVRLVKNYFLRFSSASCPSRTIIIFVRLFSRCSLFSPYRCALNRWHRCVFLDLPLNKKKKKKIWRISNVKTNVWKILIFFSLPVTGGRRTRDSGAGTGRRSALGPVDAELVFRRSSPRQNKQIPSGDQQLF